MHHTAIYTTKMKKAEEENKIIGTLRKLLYIDMCISHKIFQLVNSTIK